MPYRRLHPGKVRRFMFWYWPTLFTVMHVVMMLWAPALGPGAPGSRTWTVIGAASATFGGVAWLAFRRSPTVVMGAVSVMFALAFSRTLGIVMASIPWQTAVWWTTIWFVLASAELTIGLATLFEIHHQKMRDEARG